MEKVKAYLLNNMEELKDVVREVKGVDYRSIRCYT
ncbi:hypothetical protein 278BB001_266 [Bacillus phage 278BB001]|nr:hypothetical protein 278BB001_4 [Bacillus phage 278BB001]QZA70410.1 hypothetical protein 278BB001_266 [Bacillus phage 278BB001]